MAKSIPGGPYGGEGPPVANADKALDLSKSEKKRSDQEIKLVNWAYETFYSIKMARSQIERQWYLNLCFYYGKQNVAYRQTPNSTIGVSNTLYTPVAPYWRIRLVINLIRPMIRKELAKLTAQKPSAYVIPASSEDLDLFAAQAGEQIWESFYSDKNLKAVIRRWVWWGLICGTSFAKVCWNPDAKDYNSGLPGDISFYHETPFHVFVPDFREETLEGQPYLIHAHIKDEEWVKVNYPNVNYSANIDKENQILDQSWLNIIGATDIKGKRGILCLEVWMKPGVHSMFPDGAMFTIIGNSIVQGMQGWPYQHNCFPFVKFDHIPSGKFYHDSSILDEIPLQREYNRTRSQLVEAKNRMAKPVLVAEEGAIDPSRMTSEPGQVVEYKMGHQKPEPLPMLPIPSYVENELERIRQDFDDISGQHEVSKGTTPPGVTAATAINYLQEQDDSMLAHTFESLEEGIQQMGRLALSYVHQFWDIPRIVNIVGIDGQFDALAFKGSDLRGNTDIRVEPGSSLPTSKAAKQAFILEMMKLGLIKPSDGFEILEMGGVQKLYEKIQVDVRQAQRENLRMMAISEEQFAEFEKAQQEAQMLEEQEMMMMGQMGDPSMQDPMAQNPMAPPQDPAMMQPGMSQGQPGPETSILVPTHTYDNHAMHIEIHNRHRKSQGFENASDQTKELFEAHVNQHMLALFNEQQQQMMTGMAATGGQGPQLPGNEGGQNQFTTDTMPPPEQGTP